MAAGAGECKAEGSGRGNFFHDADVGPTGIEMRALFDVEFDEGCVVARLQ